MKIKYLKSILAWFRRIYSRMEWIKLQLSSLRWRNKVKKSIRQDTATVKGFQIRALIQRVWKILHIIAVSHLLTIMWMAVLHKSKRLILWHQMLIIWIYIRGIIIHQGIKKICLRIQCLPSIIKMLHTLHNLEIIGHLKRSIL